MPLIHVALRAGKSETYRQAILDGLYRAMREILNVPEGDQFMTISEHDAANFRYGSRVHPDHRVQHPHGGAEEGAVPADRRAARRKPGRASGGRLRGGA